jgi:serpin B
MELFRRVAARDTSSNLVISPYSVTEALAMIAAGTSGKTKQQTFASFAKHGTDLDPLSRANLRASLTQDDGTGTKVSIANAIWIDGLTVSKSYRKLLETNFGAPATRVPFQTKPKQAVLIVNNWVSKATEGQINRLLDATQITKDTSIVATNAVHVFGSWTVPFDKTQTRNAPFRRTDGKIVQASRMTGKATVSFSASPRIITLEYTTGIEMRIVVPATSTPTNLDQSMKALHRSVTQQERKSRCLEVAIQLPKWQAATRSSVAEAVKSMGIVELFSTNADYSAMLDSPVPLKLGDIFQASAITVDEQGTTASAATAAVIEATEKEASPDTCPSEVIIDRPFVYVIQQVNDGEILFAGRVTDPTR